MEKNNKFVRLADWCLRQNESLRFYCKPFWRDSQDECFLKQVKVVVICGWCTSNLCIKQLLSLHQQCTRMYVSSKNYLLNIDKWTEIQKHKHARHKKTKTFSLSSCCLCISQLPAGRCIIIWKNLLNIDKCTNLLSPSVDLREKMLKYLHVRTS